MRQVVQDHAYAKEENISTNHLVNQCHIPPSQLPLATVVSDSGFLHKTSTASICPSRLSTKGFANILSIFAAFNARVRSRARANGCISGSRLREVGAGSPGRRAMWDDGACWRTDIFWDSVKIDNLSLI